MTNGSSFPVPDLPTPITTPDPVESDPTQLPVEPELDPANPANPLSVASFMPRKISSHMRSPHAAKTLRFMANRQFMRAASFRWPNVKAPILIG